MQAFETAKRKKASPQAVLVAAASVATGGFRAQKAVARDRGVSDVTVWRWAQRGWIKIVTVCNRPYVTLASLAEFDRRAAAGEFAKQPSGAALASKKRRAQQEELA
ncbi:MAG: hypothetical protein AB9869_27280 [Verrucomicrobiia bacterium]